eukprot:6195106-Pleurochrysis_carterae.AAC.1
MHGEGGAFERGKARDVSALAVAGTAGGCVGAVARSGCSPVEAGVCEDAAERTRLSGCARGSSETDLEAEEGSSACNDAEVEEEGAARAGDAVQSQAWTDEMAQIGHDDAVAQSVSSLLGQPDCMLLCSLVAEK